MALWTVSTYRYGDSQADIRIALHDESAANTYLAPPFAELHCRCGGRHFAVLIDETAGVARGGFRPSENWQGEAS